MGVTYINGEYFGGAYEFTETLETGTTSITINNSCITADSCIDVYTDSFGINPSNIVATAGNVVITFPIQVADVEVKVRVS